MRKLLSIVAIAFLAGGCSQQSRPAKNSTAPTDAETGFGLPDAISGQPSDAPVLNAITAAAEAGMEKAIRTGYVHAVYEEICKGNNGSVTDGNGLYPASFYLCGWKNMIDEAKQRIQALGYDRKSIHQELYG